MNIALLVSGGIFIVYDFLLIVLNPGTFFDNLTSFSHVWTLMGGYLIFLGIYRIRTKHSFWETWKRWIKLTVGSFGAIIALISLINLGFILNPGVTDMSYDADYVILLGGGINKKGELPESVINRMEKAREYLELHPDAVCVATGGTLKWLPYAEAPEIKRQLVLRGISADRVLVEDKALDTIQNFKFSCAMLADFKQVSKEEILNSPVLVVTNGFHLRRAERLADRMGFKKIKGISAKCSLFYVPHSYLREICAYVKLNARILLTGEPKPL